MALECRPAAPVKGTIPNRARDSGAPDSAQEAKVQGLWELITPTSPRQTTWFRCSSPFLWVDEDRWEGKDYKVQVKASAQTRRKVRL